METGHWTTSSNSTPPRWTPAGSSKVPTGKPSKFYVEKAGIANSKLGVLVGPAPTPSGTGTGRRPGMAPFKSPRIGKLPEFFKTPKRNPSSPGVGRQYGPGVPTKSRGY